VESGRPNRPLTRLRRLVGWPARRVLDRHVEWTIAALDERLGTVDAYRTPLHDRLDELEATQLELMRAVGALAGPLVREEADRNQGPGLPPLSPEVADFLNWESGPAGVAARAGLWFNPPVALQYVPGGVEVRHVSERIVEQPFVLAGLAELERPSRVLDVGGAESTIALSAASWGHEVTAVDPRGYPLDHPNLTSIAVPLEGLDPDATGFDAAVALSSIEHFGLGHYAGAEARAGRADLEALRAIRDRMAPGGRLLLTVPLGAPAVDDFQRVYDAAGLAELLEGWDVVERSAAWRTGPTTWLRGVPEEPAGDPGVALVRARRPGGAP
jgi:SAM-dependent methyltransferase